MRQIGLLVDDIFFKFAAPLLQEIALPTTPYCIAIPMGSVLTSYIP